MRTQRSVGLRNGGLSSTPVIVEQNNEGGDDPHQASNPRIQVVLNYEPESQTIVEKDQDIPVSYTEIQPPNMS